MNTEQVDSNVDYYSVLGVDPTSRLEEIKHAYRLKSKMCHPDGGGTQEQFIKLNFAWEVLSNPEVRAYYDAVRAKPQNAKIVEAWNAASRSANEKANQTTKKYSGDRSDFERWVDSVTKDFQAAEYGSRRGSRIDEATVSKSVSGDLFVKWGRGIGYVAALIYLVQLPLPTSPEFWNNNDWRYFVLVLIAPAIGGWLGQWAHRIIRHFMVGWAKRKVKPAPLIIQCRCGQKLRIPDLPGILKVNCAKCRRVFGIRTCFSNPHEVCLECGRGTDWNGTTCTKCNGK